MSAFPERERVPRGFLLLAGGASLATGCAHLAGAPPALALLPSAAAVIWAAWSLPLRLTGAAVLFFSLALDVKSDAGGFWHTPLAVLGDALRQPVEETLGIPGVRLAGIEVLLLFVLAVHALRRRSARARSARCVPAAPVLRSVILVYVAAVLFAFANGLATGGRFALWQFRLLMQVPLYFAFFLAVFRGPADHVLVGRAIVAAACVKGALAVVVQRVAVARTGGELAYATNHGDSMLFTVGVLLVVLHVLERPDRARILRATPPLLLMLLGIRDNNRRLVFIELGMALGAAYLLTPWAGWKRRITRAAVLGMPLVLLYVAVGWSSTTSVLFAPVRTLRTITNDDTSRSTLWRSVENWNIARSLRDRPLLGLGMSKEYTEYIPNDDISTAYPEYRCWPHNSVLGLLLFGGPIAFTGMWSLLAVSVFLAVRSFRRATAGEDRVAALAVVAAVLACAVQSYGDLGATFTQHRLLEGLALAVAGKLAVATGAWPVRPRAHVAPRTLASPRASRALPAG